MEKFETRSEENFNFQAHLDLVPTVEIDSDSLEERGIYLHLEPLFNFLKNKASLNHLATIYTAEFESFNFGTPCNSIFISIVGANWLEEILNLYKSIRGVRARYSDSLDLSEMNCTFQVESGKAWEPYEPEIWKAIESSTSIVNATSKTAFDDADYGEEFIDIENPLESLLPSAPFSQDSNKISSDVKIGRVRRARADASVKSIQKNIERIFGLPIGSVKLTRPSGRAFNEDAKMIDFRNAWEKN